MGWRAALPHQLQPVKSPPMASPGSVRVRLPAVLAAAAATVVAGCTTVPSGGAAQLVASPSSQVQPYEEPLPPPGPRAYADPGQVVLGFLHASASYAIDHAAAKQFLSPALQKTWRPRGPVTVVSSINNGRPPKPNSRLEPTYTGGDEATVDFTGQRLATLSSAGQYQYSPGSPTYQFTLRQFHNEWLISQLPQADQDSLLLLQWDFEHVYQARNLFFFAGPPPSVNGKLVPDPVYAPLQSSDSALNVNLASGLVHGLIKDQYSWLSSATKTAFPHGTTLLGVTISGQTAVVNLGGTAVHANATQRQEMEQQLRATLGSTAYSAALARSVVLEINGRRAYMPTPLPNLIYDLQRGPLAYQKGEDIISELKPAQQIAGTAQFGLADITAMATAPANTPGDVRVAVAAKDQGGCQVYLPPGAGPGSPTGPDISRTLSTSGGECTSLSWDRNLNLWAASGRNIWVLRAPTYRKQLVNDPVNLTSGRQPVILSLRMAPDAVRAALLIKAGRKARLVLAAVDEGGNQLCLGTAVDVGTSLQDPIAMSWYNPYDLVVLDKSGIAEVPLTGGPGQQIEPVPPGAQSLTTDGAALAIGTDSNGKQQIRTASALGALWSAPQTGSLPAYPG